MGVEIERKFTVRGLPGELDNYPYRDIEQGYLNVSPAIRVRAERSITDPHRPEQVTERYYMTYKGAGVMAREEYNLALDAGSYEHMRAKADGHILDKRRFLIPGGSFRGYDLTIELDVFRGSHDGLIIAEVEFPDEETAQAYEPPDWFDTDVTGDPAYSNARLANS